MYVYSTYTLYTIYKMYIWYIIYNIYTHKHNEKETDLLSEIDSHDMEAEAHNHSPLATSYRPRREQERDSSQSPKARDLEG